MPTLAHYPLPRGTQIELLNVMAHVARRDDDDPTSDYVLYFEDPKTDVKVYVPMAEKEYRDWITRQYEMLSKVVPPSARALEIVGKR